MAERVYPFLYVFENSLRDLIELVLKAKYGDRWWTTAVPAKVREAAEELKEQEKKDTLHGKRGRRDIDYLLLTQLWKIVNHKWKDFEALFPPGKHWVQTVIETEMNVSRRPIAHMNPLEDDDIKNVENTFRKWVRNLQKVADKLPQPGGRWCPSGGRGSPALPCVPPRACSCAEASALGAWLRPAYAVLCRAMAAVEAVGAPYGHWMAQPGGLACPEARNCRHFIGAPRFELGTSVPQTSALTRLRHAPWG